MFHLYELNFFKKGETIQEGTLFKEGGHYLRKYGIHQIVTGRDLIKTQQFAVLSLLSFVISI